MRFYWINRLTLGLLCYLVLFPLLVSGHGEAPTDTNQEDIEPNFGFLFAFLGTFLAVVIGMFFFVRIKGFSNVRS